MIDSPPSSSCGRATPEEKTYRSRIYEAQRFERHLCVRALLAAVLTLAIAAPAEAAESAAATQVDAPSVGPNGESEQALQEVIVTAEKRVKNALDVPSSVSVISDDLLKETNVAGVSDLQKAVPGFTFVATQTPSQTSLQIRGISTVTFSNAIEPSVGTVIDGVVMGRQGFSLFNFDDVKRVEVLRGPQGTLFGMNSSAGLLNIVTEDPTNEFSARAGVSYGTYNDVKVNAAVSGPLVEDKLLGRISAYSDKRDGYIHNDFDGRDLNNDNENGFRAKLLFKPREGRRILLSFDLEKMDSDCCVSTLRTSLDPIASLSNNKVNEFFSGTTTERARGVSAQWDENLGGYALTSISAYRDWSELQIQNYYSSFSPTPILVCCTTRSHQVTQELRVASPIGGVFDYVAGVFLLSQRVNGDNNITIYTTPALRYRTTDAEGTHNYAGFGEGNIHLNDHFTLVVGARWTDETVTMHLVSPEDPAFIPILVPVGVINDSISARKLSWRVGAQWKPVRNSMAYATVSRGFKGPAFNTVSGTGTSEPVSPEIATNYEVGWKSEFWNHRARATADVYFETIDDYQTQASVNSGVIGPNGQPLQSFELKNAAALQSKGVELAFDAAPLPGLTVGLNAAYIDAVFKDFPDAPCWGDGTQTAAQGCEGIVPGVSAGVQNLAGAPLPSTPKWSANTNVRYDFLVHGPVNGFVTANYSWRSAVQWDVLQSPTAIAPAYGLVGASIGIQDVLGRYVFTVYADNITNTFYTTRIYPGIPESSQYLAPDYKRLLGVRFEYRFN